MMHPQEGATQALAPIPEKFGQKEKPGAPTSPGFSVEATSTMGLFREALSSSPTRNILCHQDLKLGGRLSGQKKRLN